MGGTEQCSGVGLGRSHVSASHQMPFKLFWELGEAMPTLQLTQGIM